MSTGLPTLAEAHAGRDAGIAKVATNAERTSPRFAERARAFILDYLATRESASAELITAEAKCAGVIPHDDRAFGSVYRAMANRGLIVKVGTCARLRGHGTAGGNI